MAWTGKLLCVLLLPFASCGIYSFSGASTTAKTVKIDEFYNLTDLAPANVSATFVNGLKDYLQQNSGLSVVSQNGDLTFDGVISEYSLSPQAPTLDATGAALASQTRLTISVKINYVDLKEAKNSFKERVFTNNKLFNSNLDFTSIQAKLEKEIFQLIYLDIFNATIANW